MNIDALRDHSEAIAELWLDGNYRLAFVEIDHVLQNDVREGIVLMLQVCSQLSDSPNEVADFVDFATKEMTL